MTCVLLYTYMYMCTYILHTYMSRQEQKPDIWVPSSKKVRAEKIQIFSDLKKIYSGLQIDKLKIFTIPKKFQTL